MKTSEHKEQCALMQWWALACKGFGLPEALLFAIPNGGHRHIAVAAKMKAEGVRAGVPDLFLAVPKGAYTGLFIELKKVKGGVVSDSQREALMLLSARGYAVAVCRGWRAASRYLEQYLNEGVLSPTEYV